MLNYRLLTVAELRNITKSRGLPQQKGGKKYTKLELVRQLVLNDHDGERNETKQKQNGENSAEPEGGTKISFVQIVKKYSGRKTDEEYRDMKSGDIVVFVHHVDAADGNVYRKIRQAKIVKVDEKKECVGVEMFFGEKLNILFEDILYIRKDGESLPKDIRLYLRYKRTDDGKKIITERLVGNGKAEN